MQPHRPARFSRSLANARAAGLRADVFTVEEFAAFLPADGGEAKFWESIGHVRGDERFHHTRMRRAADAIEILGTFDGCPAGTTQVICRYPFGQGRTVRVLTRKP
jgi:hypothetical protein